MESFKSIIKALMELEGMTNCIGGFGLVLHLFIFIRMIVVAHNPEYDTLAREVYQIVIMTMMNLVTTILLLIGNCLEKPILMVPGILLHITYFFVEVTLTLRYILCNDNHFEYYDAIIEYGILGGAYVVTILCSYIFIRRYIQLEAKKKTSDEQCGFEHRRLHA